MSYVSRALFSFPPFPWPLPPLLPSLSYLDCGSSAHNSKFLVEGGVDEAGSVGVGVGVGLCIAWNTSGGAKDFSSSNSRVACVTGLRASSISITMACDQVLQWTAPRDPKMEVNLAEDTNA